MVADRWIEWRMEIGVGIVSSFGAGVWNRYVFRFGVDLGLYRSLCV